MYKIRNMEQRDIPQVWELEDQLFSIGWSEESIRTALEQQNVQIIVAESRMDQEVIGYCIFYGGVDEGDIARIGVRPECQRMGVGDEILAHMWNCCMERGIPRVLLEVRVSNDRAIALYEKHGFKTLGVRKSYYQKPVEDGLIMEKQIDITTGKTEV